MESKSSALGVFWSPTLQLWAFFGVQRFSVTQLSQGEHAGSPLHSQANTQVRPYIAFFALVKYKKGQTHRFAQMSDVLEKCDIYKINYRRSDHYLSEK
ncbi:MAG: hypothetical protein KAI83_03665 [Thiomargarita sp.]|nr:hypothetical protein [Thiomargarita sp.]